MTLTLNMPPELESRLRDQAAREGIGADDYALRTLRDALTRKPSARGAKRREAELLKKVHLKFPDEFWERYHELRSKLDDQTLTAAERREMIGISDRLERANARRMRYVVQLANLRGVPLEQLMKQLGIGEGREIPNRRARGG
jgi:hypothetical protein